jgi:hypothetical protein
MREQLISRSTPPKGKNMNQFELCTPLKGEALTKISTISVTYHYDMYKDFLKTESSEQNHARQSNQLSDKEEQ